MNDSDDFTGPTTVPGEIYGIPQDRFPQPPYNTYDGHRPNAYIKPAKRTIGVRANELDKTLDSLPGKFKNYHAKLVLQFTMRPSLTGLGLWILGLAAAALVVTFVVHPYLLANQAHGIQLCDLAFNRATASDQEIFQHVRCQMTASRAVRFDISIAVIGLIAFAFTMVQLFKRSAYAYSERTSVLNKDFGFRAKVGGIVTGICLMLFFVIMAIMG